MPEFLPTLRAALRLEKKDVSQRVRASASGGYPVPGQPYSNTWNVQRATEEGYEGNPLVYRCIEVICQHAVSLNMIMRLDDPEKGDLVDLRHDPTRLLYVLNRRANPWETGKIFRHRMIAQFLLSSKGVFIEVIRTTDDRIGILHLLDPDLTDMVPVEKRDPVTNEVLESDPMGAFQIQVPEGGYNYLPRFDPAASAQEQPASVLWIRSPHPLVMWKGMSPVQATGLSIDLDRYARLYNRRFLQNDGRPGGLLAVKGASDRDTLERLQAQFNGGIDSAGRTTVIRADAINYADTSGTPRDLMWGELTNGTRKEIRDAFGVPESVLGDASGRTFDNADAEFEIFWQGRMKSLLDLLDDQLDVLTGGVDDRHFLRHDISTVWVLGRHKRQNEDRHAEDLERGAITINEYREVRELEPWDVPAAKVLWLQPGKIPVGQDDETTEAAAALQQAGIGMPADVGEEAQRGAEIGGTVGARLANNDVQASRLRLAASEGRPVAAALERRGLEPLEIEAKADDPGEQEGEERRARGVPAPER